MASVTINGATISTGGTLDTAQVRTVDGHDVSLAGGVISVGGSMTSYPGNGEVGNGKVTVTVKGTDAWLNGKWLDVGNLFLGKAPSAAKPMPVAEASPAIKPLQPPPAAGDAIKLRAGLGSSFTGAPKTVAPGPMPGVSVSPLKDGQRTITIGNTSISLDAKSATSMNVTDAQGKPLSIVANGFNVTVNGQLLKLD